jgi:DNA-binding GntR family transcriptional regulator
MTSGRSTRPLLADVVRDGLRRAIIAGEFRAGSKIPNEDRLSERFAVSRATIREAVRGLVEDSYLDRRHGSGTFVTGRPVLRNSLDRNFSYTGYLESLGLRAGKQLLEARIVPADDATAGRLVVPVGTPLAELRRVRTADGTPAIYSIDRLPTDLIDIERDIEAMGGSLYELLASRGQPVAHGEAIVVPAAADDEVAAALQVEPGTLLQALEQVDVSSSGRPVLLSLEWHVPAVIELRVFRRGPG